MKIMIGFVLLLVVMPMTVVGEDTWCDAVEARADAPYGLIRWRTSMEEAKAEAAKTGAPLVVLSDKHTEAGKGFAKTTLSFFYIVDGANAFIPVLAKKGATQLTFTKADGSVLTEPLPATANIGRVLKGMTHALAKAGRPVPTYLEMAAAYYGAGNPQTMYIGYG